MSNRRISARFRVKFLVAIACCLVATLVAIGIYWSQRKIELDDRGYDITLALYRICNQKSDVGLAQIATMLDEQNSVILLSDGSRSALTQIVNKAKMGDWAEAQSLTRRVLDDQVKRR